MMRHVIFIAVLVATPLGRVTHAAPPLPEVDSANAFIEDRVDARQTARGGSVDAPEYNRHVAPIFAKYCNSCHNADDAEGGLVLENFERLLRGGKRGCGYRRWQE